MALSCGGWKASLEPHRMTTRAGREREVHNRSSFLYRSWCLHRTPSSPRFPSTAATDPFQPKHSVDRGALSFDLARRIALWRVSLSLLDGAFIVGRDWERRQSANCRCSIDGDATNWRL